MNGDEILVKRIVSEINAELSNILKLRDEYIEFINKYDSEAIFQTIHRRQT